MSPQRCFQPQLRKPSPPWTELWMAMHSAVVQQDFSDKRSQPATRRHIKETPSQAVAGMSPYREPLDCNRLH